MGTPRNAHPPDPGRLSAAYALTVAGERELIERMCAADEGDARAAFEAVFRTFYAPLCEFALTYVATHDDAEEIVSDLLCRLWEQRLHLAIRESLRAYLYVSVRNRALKAARRSRPVQAERDIVESESALAAETPVATGLDGVERRELQAAIASAIATLPVRCRQAYTLRHLHDLSYGEIAQAMGTSVKTVEVQLWRALKSLRRQLAEWYE